MKNFILFLILFLIFPPLIHSSEVIEKTPAALNSVGVEGDSGTESVGFGARVVVRQHPKTGKPYVTITDDLTKKDPFERFRGPGFRPDYRMLDPKVKPGEIPYEGPYTSSKKIYIFAATLATLGAASGVAVLAAAPATATAAGTAAGGGGAYLAGAGIVTGAATAGTVAVTKSNPNQDNFTQTSKSEREKEK